MYRSLVTVAAALAALTSAVPTFAGIADSPIPQLMGEDARHLYSVPGLVNSGGVGTFFACTSTSTSGSIRVGVEMFNATGGTPINNASTTSVALSSGATVTFGTSTATGVRVDVDLAAPILISNGSARILSTSKSLVCTAYAADTLSGPPTSSWYLTIVAKLKQKAAN